MRHFDLPLFVDVVAASKDRTKSFGLLGENHRSIFIMKNN